MFKFEPFRHLAYLNQLRAKLPQPLRYNLSDSSAASMTVQQLLDLDPNSDSHFAQLDLRYASVGGEPALRAAIMALHPRINQVDAANAAVFCGAQEALFCVFNALLKPDDEVITFTPCYPSLLTVPQQLGAKVHTIPLHFDQQWQVNIETIKAKITAKTRLFVLNSPQNPTGAVFEQALINEIIALARQQGIYILSDEVSRLTVFESDPAVNGDSLFGYEKAVCIGVLSKSFGLAGIRIGWVVSQDHALIQRLLEIKGYLSICPSLMDEYLAQLAINHRHTIIPRNNQIAAANRVRFGEFIDHSDGLFAWHPPKAGLLTLVQSNLTIPIQQLAEQLAIQHQLLILPGELFYGPENTFRLGLGQPDFTDSLARFAKDLDRSYTRHKT